MTGFMDDLRPASWRGIPFAVVSADSEFGRRNAVHEYPFKDTVWVEDLGRAARRISLLGYLVEDDLIYGGVGGSDKIAAQRDRLVAAAEAGDEGKLVHPTLGELTVSLIKVGVSERLSHLGVMEIGFSFIEAGKRTFPASVTQTPNRVADCAFGSDAACATDFSSTAGPALVGDLPTSAGLEASSSWLDKAQSLGSDAAGILGEVAQLPGEFGRFLGDEADSIFGTGTVSGIGGVFSSVGEIVSQLTIVRGRLTSAIAGIVFGGASLLNQTGSFASSIQGIVGLLIQGAQLPSDALRILSQLADFTPKLLVGSSPLVINGNAVAQAVGALARRSAVTGLARVSAHYKPASYDDAVAVRTLVTGALDTEITVAGDRGEDLAYTALRTLRVAVAEDLTTRGASLAPIVTVRFQASLPSLVLGQRLYQDPNRSNELESEAHVRHPGFMPLTFRALAS